MKERPLTSIQQQLQLLFVLTMGLAILIIGAVWISSDRTQHKSQAEHVLAIEADLIGVAIRPALMFDDTRLAHELLNSLLIDQDVSSVLLFTNQGKTFITFPADQEHDVPFQQQGTTFVDGKLQMYRTIMHKGSAVGVVYIESRLTRLHDSELKNIIAILGVMFGSLVFGLAIAMRLQRRIATPLTKLAELMRQMGSEQHYDLRAQVSSSNRETMELTTGFNQMAEKIQSSFLMIEEQHKHLKESAKRFRNIVELAPMPVIISRAKDGRILFYNRASADLFGVDSQPEEPISTLEFFQNPQERQQILKTIAELGEIDGYELQVKKADGTPIWVSLSMVQMDFEQENALFTAFSDITAQKNIEQQLEQRVAVRTNELAQAKGELQATLDNLLDTYYRINADGTVNWASKSIKRLLDYQVMEIKGMPLQSVFAERREYHQFIRDLVSRDGIIMNCEIRLRHRDGHIVWGSVSSHYLRNSNGEIIGAEGVLRDITDLKLADMEKQEMEKRVAHVQRLESLGVLAGGIAHDFNNLLAAIMGNSELAKLKADDQEPIDKELAGITACSKRAADLCQQMLAYSGQGSGVKKTINISLLVEEIVQLIDISITKSGALKLSLADSLPAIYADETQMQQVIMNLVTNASEAIGDDPGQIHISTGSLETSQDKLVSSHLDQTLPQGQYIYLEVSDTGCGMDEETREKIFDPFFTTKFTGRGLGMSAMLGIVHSHKGTIHVESHVGKGTCVRVLLPVAGKPVNTTADYKPDSIEVEKEITSHVLVIDDEPDVLATTEAMLKKLGCSVLTASDGQQGLSIYAEKWPDINLILLDMTMPDMSGRETLTKLQKINGRAAVVICSGYGYDNISDQFEDNPPAGFLHKPYSFQLLKHTVRQFSKHSTGRS